MTAEHMKPDFRQTMVRQGPSLIDWAMKIADAYAKIRDSDNLKDIRDQVASQLPNGTPFTVVIPSGQRSDFNNTPQGADIYVGDAPPQLSEPGNDPMIDYGEGTNASPVMPIEINIKMPGGQTVTTTPKKNEQNIPVHREPGLETGTPIVIPPDRSYDGTIT